MKKDLKELRGPLNQITERSENETDKHFIKSKHIETSIKVVHMMEIFKKPKAMKFPKIVDCKEEMEEFKKQQDKPEEMKELAEEEFKNAENINFNELIGELDEGDYTRND